MALEPRYPSNGGNLLQLEGSEDLSTYLPGMKHPDPSVTHCKVTSQLSHVFINVNTLLPHDICVSPHFQTQTLLQHRQCLVQT